MPVRIFPIQNAGENPAERKNMLLAANKPCPAAVSKAEACGQCKDRPWAAEEKP